MNRHFVREKALQALFQVDMSDTEPLEAIRIALEEGSEDETKKLGKSKRYFAFLEELVLGVIEQRPQIDELLRESLDNWTLERVANVDRVILRIAVYEMKYTDDIPVNVVLNEAIELAKSFGDEKTSKFVNGVLSKVKDSLGK